MNCYLPSFLYYIYKYTRTCFFIATSLLYKERIEKLSFKRISICYSSREKLVSNKWNK